MTPTQEEQPLDIAILHYTAPPVIGGVEAVIRAHTGLLVEAGHRVTVIAGRGEQSALPDGARFLRIPELDSQHGLVLRMSEALEQGDVPAEFDDATDSLAATLEPTLRAFDAVIVHNVFTKHFNLPFTAALHRLLDAGAVDNCIAWCHDITWTSPRSRSKVHPGQPWDLLRTYHPELTYVAVSQRRQQALASLFQCPKERIHVVYNGVEPKTLLGLSDEGLALIERLGLLAADLVLLMPVRVTQAKNIEFALRVLAALKAQGCGAKLVVTGPPDPHDPQSMAYFRSLQSLREELGLQEDMRFVYESGADPEQPYPIGMGTVGELMRASDVMFMPSHREGFGMPVLEAGLLGLTVACTCIPAAEELGGADVILLASDEDPAQVAERILTHVEQAPHLRLRRRVRQQYTWHAILQRDIEPLLAPRRKRS